MAEEIPIPKMSDKYGVSFNINLAELSTDIYLLRTEIRGIIHNTQQIEDLVRNMPSRAELNQALTKLNDALVSEVKEIQDTIGALKAKIEQLSVPEDFSAEIARLTEATNNIANVIPSAPSAPITPEIVEETIAAPPEPTTPENPPLTSEDLTPAPEPLPTEEGVATS